MMGGDGMGWGMGWAWLFGLLLLVGVIILITLLVLVLVRGGASGRQPGAGAPPTGTGPERAREILQERFARGEIGAEEFRERLTVLKENDR